MPDRRGRKGSMKDFIPENREQWAKWIWRDRADVAKIDGGAWLLREAAEILGLSEETVTDVLRRK